MQVKTKTIAVPPDSFFKEAEREYSNVNERLIIEFLQNSIDAGASTIKFVFSNNRLIVTDNGKGMNRDQLLNGMLTFSGSIKDSGSTGGFGAAKKILLFSHKSYRIKTRQFNVFGEVINYDITEETDIDNCLLGTEIEIEFAEFWPGYDNLENILKEHIQNIISQSSIVPRIYWNGEEIKSLTMPAIELDEPTAIIRKAPNTGIIIRFNGLYMFKHGSTKHSYFYDCKGHSRDALNQNRESFRAGDYREAYNSFVNTLANNNQSGISAQADFQKKKDTQRVIEGITFFSDNLPYKLSKRQKSIYALCQTVCEMMGWTLPKSHFGFYVNPNVRGLGSQSAIFINPEYFLGDDWELGCVETFIHEWCHYKGYSHDESFINYFGRLWVKFMKQYSGINPLKARARIIEKREFPNY